MTHQTMTYNNSGNSFLPLGKVRMVILFIMMVIGVGSAWGQSTDSYDYDATISANAAHLTRSGIAVRNTFTLNQLALSDSPVEIQAGKYYDLRVTLNPDYLYVLSEHDNKHITIE